MINVTVLESPLLSNVAYWRLYRPLQIVRLLYPGVFNFTFKKEKLDYSDAWGADIVICPRPGQKPDVTDFLEKARENGSKIIVDMDDDILNLPLGHDLYHDYKEGTPARMQAEKTIKLADFFWYSTPEFLKTYPKNGIVAFNAVLPQELPDEPAPDMGLWAWRGRSIQIHDLIGAGWDWYGKIRSKPKQWMFIGFLPPLRHVENVLSVPYVADTQKYMDNLRRHPINGFWKPMIDHPFNDHKSNIAWIEATMSGGVCLTNYAGRPGWEHATAHFPTYTEACKLWEKSKEEIKTKYNLLAMAQLRAQSMLALCSHLVDTSQHMAVTSP